MTVRQRQAHLARKRAERRRWRNAEIAWQPRTQEAARQVANEFNLPYSKALDFVVRRVRMGFKV